MFSEGGILENKIQKCFTKRKLLQESFRNFPPISFRFFHWDGLLPGWPIFWSYRPCPKVLKGKFQLSHWLSVSLLYTHLYLKKKEKKNWIGGWPSVFIQNQKLQTLFKLSQSPSVGMIEQVCIWMWPLPIISAPLERRESIHSCWDVARGQVSTNMTAHFYFTLRRMFFQEHLKTIPMLKWIKTVWELRMFSLEKEGSRGQESCP